jgi:hypothetical protein
VHVLLNGESAEMRTGVSAISGGSTTGGGAGVGAGAASSPPPPQATVTVVTAHAKIHPRADMLAPGDRLERRIVRARRVCGKPVG